MDSVMLLGALAPDEGTYPWQVDDPWVRLTSEVLLSRTRRTVVARVFPKFIGSWPTPDHLAAASVDGVWQVIRETGFRRRADQLVAIGTAVAADGAVPHLRDDLLELPGVGEYAADAVCLLAFDGDRMPLDMNVDRVASRLNGTPMTPVGRSPYRNDTLVELSHGLMQGTLAQRRAVFTGILEVSALTCRPRPNCGECPLSGTCELATAARHSEMVNCDRCGTLHQQVTRLSCSIAGRAPYTGG